MRISEVRDPSFNRAMNKIQGGVGAGPSQTLEDCFVQLSDLKENIKKLHEETGRKFEMPLSDALEGIIDISAALNKLTKEVPLP